MADIITFKRGPKTALPNSALKGEPLFCIDTQELYVGLGAGNEPACFPSKATIESILKTQEANLLLKTEQLLNNDFGTY